MKLCCSTITFQGLPLDGALGRIHELGFELADLLIYTASEWGHLAPEDVRADPDAAFDHIESAQKTGGVRVASLQVLTNENSDRERGDFEAACDLAARLGIGTISTFCFKRDPTLERNRLKDFLTITRDRGQTLCVETAPWSFILDPEAAYGLLAGTPGLFLTLHTGSLTSHGFPKATWTQLFRFVRNCYITDAGPTPDRGQVPWGTGEVDFPFLINGLRKAGYNGPLTIEYAGPRKEDTLMFDPIPEIVKARDTLQKLISS